MVKVALTFLLPAAVAQAQVPIFSIFRPNNTLQPIASNLLNFRGFNFTNLTGETVVHSPTSQIWRLQVNYSVEPLVSPASIGSIPLYAYALQFFDRQLPWENQTTWRMSTPSDAESGDCSPYLGDECVRDYTSTMSNNAGYQNCPRALSLLDVPSCKARIGSWESSQGIISRPISNWIAPDIQYFDRNNTFVNSSTGEAITNPEVRGLRSGQVCMKYGSSGLDLHPNMTEQQREASTLQFVVLTKSPSENWIRQQRVLSTQGFSDVRLVCGRANSTFNGTIIDRQPSGNSASRGFASDHLLTKMASLTILVLLLTYLM